MLRICRVLDIAVRDIRCQRHAAFAFGLLHGPDFAAGIARVELVEPVLDSREVVVDAVRFGGIEIVVDGDVADAVLWEGEIGVKPGQRGVSAQPGQVLRDGNGYMTGLHF